MKRATIIFTLGLILSVAAFCGLYFGKTASHRALLQTETPELAWLKHEFNLSDTEFTRISQLHDGYMPHCAEMCKRIGSKNSELKALLTHTNVLTAEIEQKLSEASQLRLECQKMMLAHFMEVSRAMPPEQGKRYLAWVQEQTLLPEWKMKESH